MRIVFGLLFFMIMYLCLSLVPAQADDARAPYTVRAGDVLTLTVFGEDELSGPQRVDEGGALKVPLAGGIDISGLSLAEAERRIQDALANGYLKNPVVLLSVDLNQPFYILGEVRKPGRYRYNSGLTVLEAVAMAGGFTYHANERRAEILHKGGAMDDFVTVTYDTPVRPGDVIKVEDSFF